MRVSALAVAVAAVVGIGGCSSSDANGPAPATVPTGVKASVTGGTIDLTWNTVAGAVGYKVYMAEVGGVTRTNIATLPGNMTHKELPASFSHPAGLASATKYYFVVTAIRADSSESDESCEVNAKIATNEATTC
jgi:hypothetical protein